MYPKEEARNSNMNLIHSMQYLKTFENIVILFLISKRILGIHCFLKVTATNRNIPISSVGSNDDELINLGD